MAEKNLMPEGKPSVAPGTANLADGATSGPPGASNTSDSSDSSRRGNSVMPPRSNAVKSQGTDNHGSQAPTSETSASSSGIRSRFEKTKSALSAQESGSSRETFLTHIDPMSAFKVGFVFNLALFAIWVVAMILLWIVLNVAGVWDRLNSLAGDLADGEFSAGLYFGVVLGLGLFELVVFTLLAPVLAVIFNSAASLFGGLRIGLGSTWDNQNDSQAGRGES